jgi:hypothetical protein
MTRKLELNAKHEVNAKKYTGRAKLVNYRNTKDEQIELNTKSNCKFVKDEQKRVNTE